MRLHLNKILFIILTVVFAACDDDKPVDNPKRILFPEMYEDLSCPFDYDETDSDNVLGKWKLVRTVDTIDYSCNNITYEFTNDGRFIIESDVEEIPDTVYSYTGGENLKPNSGLPRGTMVINDSIYFYTESAYGTLYVGATQETSQNGGLICEYSGFLLRIN